MSQNEPSVEDLLSAPGFDLEEQGARLILYLNAGHPADW